MSNEKSQSKYSRRNVVTSLIWKLLERGGNQAIQLVIQIVLARLLVPEDFGTIAIVMAFVHLATVFVQSGLNTALIQKKDADRLDFSSVFFLSLFLALVLYIIIFFLAPFIASFYSNQDLIIILRVLALMLFPGAFNSIQNAYISKNMMFRKNFYSSLIAILISGTIGIALAYSGLGVWALVVQQLLNQTVITIVLWFTVKWRPIFKFSFERIRILFAFGSRLLLSNIINTLYLEIRTLYIGRYYPPSSLGFYNRGELIPKVIVSNVDGSVQAVMLPTIASIQDNIYRVKQVVRRSITSSSYLIFPLMLGLAAVAEPLVIVLLTEKWLPAVPFLRIFCISFSLQPIHTTNLQAMNALGRSDLFLRLEIVKKIIGLSILIISIPFGIYTIAIGQIIGSVISSFINAYPNKNLFQYSYFEQIRDILPAFFLALVMSIVVFLMNSLPLAPLPLLTLQVITGIVIYVLLSKITKIESFTYSLGTIKELLGNRNK
ncbi:MAG: lipopolysaccharide biosynthesis protein [Bacteroidales bacterium]|nr:lipopolysaccharide biosynthesis protein [Bacteroidales bacterium]